jgi:hypothetical protein
LIIKPELKLLHNPYSNVQKNPRPTVRCGFYLFNTAS